MIEPQQGAIIQYAAIMRDPLNGLHSGLRGKPASDGALSMSMFYKMVLALIVIVTSVEMADAKVKRKLHYQQKAERVWYRLSDEAYSHCGQRTFSVSVGNPAFPDRVIWWPRPCGW